MSETRYLDLEDLLIFTRMLGAGPVRDPGLLDAAAARARSTVFGADSYPTVELKAAALLHSIVRHHALVDGNRRLGLLACITFLRANGQQGHLADDEAFDLVLAVAEGRLDVPEIAKTLARSLDTRR